jgi:hypothetical protein
MIRYLLGMRHGKALRILSANTGFALAEPVSYLMELFFFSRVISFECLHQPEEQATCALAGLVSAYSMPSSGKQPGLSPG